MRAADLATLIRRLRAATAFRDYVQLDQLFATFPGDGRDGDMRRWLREEVEVEAGPLVYAALQRKDQATPEADDDVPEFLQSTEASYGAEEEPGPETTIEGMQVLDTDDDASVDAIVERIVRSHGHRPWTEQAADDVGTQDLATDPAFQEAMAAVEREAAGEFGVVPLTGAERPYRVRIAAAFSAATLHNAAGAFFAADEGTLTEEERQRIRHALGVRSAALRGAEYNANGIALRRTARAMGIGPDVLAEVHRLQAARHMGNVVRATAEVIQEQKDALRRMASQDDDDGMPQRLQRLISERVSAKRQADRLIDASVPLPPTPPPAPSAPPTPVDPSLPPSTRRPRRPRAS